MTQGDGPALVCLGNLTLDDLVQPDGSLHPGCIGGDALYGTLAARLCLEDTQMVAPIGHDLPAHVRAHMSRIGLSSAGLPERDRATLRGCIEYRDHDRRIVTMFSSDEDFEVMSPRPDDVPAGYWNAGAALVLAMPLRAQRDLVAAWRLHSRALIALDPQAEYIAGNEPALLDLFGEVDLFMPSLAEVFGLLGHIDLPRAARQFAARGPRLVVIKCGATGSLIHDATTDTDLPIGACPAWPIDTTGAGDAYCAAFVAALLTTRRDLVAAGRAGAVAASFAVEGYGMDGLLEASPARFQRRLAEW